MTTHLLTDTRAETLCGKAIDFPARSGVRRPPSQSPSSVPQGRMIRGFQLLAMARTRPPVCDECLATRERGRLIATCVRCGATVRKDDDWLGWIFYPYYEGDPPRGACPACRTTS